MLPTSLTPQPLMCSSRNHCVPWQHGYPGTSEAIPFSGEKKTAWTIVSWDTFLLSSIMKEYMAVRCQFSCWNILGKKKALQFLEQPFPLLNWNPSGGSPSPYSSLNCTHNYSLILLFLGLHIPRKINYPFCYMWLISACTVSFCLTQQFWNNVLLLCLISTIECN